MLIQIECDTDKVVAILEATKSFARTAKLFSQAPLPDLPSERAKFEERALAIAKWIRPRPNQAMRLETLEFVLNGGDTWLDQHGEADPALRNATGALSKALRRFAPFEESPLEILCERRRQTIGSGPYKGRYQGTRYVPTRLGKRVREILQEWGVLKMRGTQGQ
jgi:hypothetical protein